METLCNLRSLKPQIDMAWGNRPEWSSFNIFGSLNLSPVLEFWFDMELL